MWRSGALDQESVRSPGFPAGSSGVRPWARPSVVSLPVKCRDELNQCFLKSTKQFGEVHGWMFKNILNKSKFKMILKYKVNRILRVHWYDKNHNKGGTRFTNVRKRGNYLFPVHIFKFCNQNSSPYKPEQKAVNISTTSHLIKLYTKWKQAKLSEWWQVIHTLIGSMSFNIVTVDSKAEVRAHTTT